MGSYTTATVKSIARWPEGNNRAAPVPEPPPIPAVMKTISAPEELPINTSSLSSAAFAASLQAVLQHKSVLILDNG